MGKKKFQSKKDKVMAKSKPPYMLIGFVAVVIIAVGLIVGLKSGGSNAPAGGEQVNVGTPTNANNAQSIEMTDLQADIAGGKISVNVDDIKKNRIIRFEVPAYSIPLKNGQNVPLPLVAYISDKGNIKVAVSDCEPCSGTRFHIEGSDLVCNACGTRWNLDDLKAISGGCTQYPPDQVPYKVEGSKLVIDEAAVKNWKPRV